MFNLYSQSFVQLASYCYASIRTEPVMRRDVMIGIFFYDKQIIYDLFKEKHVLKTFKVMVLSKIFLFSSLESFRVNH